MSQKPILYDEFGCPFGQRVLMGLVHKGIDYDHVKTDQQRRTIEYLDISPTVTLPALVHRNKTISESPIILEYIDDAWPHLPDRLLPSDPYAKARVRLICDIIEKSIVGSYYVILKNHSKKEQHSGTVKLLEGILEVFRMSDASGPFLLGEEFGFADIMLAPVIQRLDVVLKAYRMVHVPTCDKFASFREWWQAVQGHDCYVTSAESNETLLKHYAQYE